MAKSAVNNLLSRSVGVKLGLIQHIREVNVSRELGLPKGGTCKYSPKKTLSSPTVWQFLAPYYFHSSQRSKRVEQNGILERVMEPTKWVASVVPVIKLAGKVRICVGLTKLNKNVRDEQQKNREIHDNEQSTASCTN